MSKSAGQEEFTYLEDVQSVAKAEVVSKEDTGTSSATVNTMGEKSSSAGTRSSGSGTLKRQRTLMEVMSGGSKSTDSDPTAKKTRIVVSGVASASSVKAPSCSPPKASSLGMQSLNSIPFSMSGYLESLTEEQKKYLALECETMGKSWLKVLKDEIRKPYFIKLKQFLWTEGVRGPNDPVSNVYPAPQNIYAWSNTPLGRLKVVIIGQDPYHGPKQAHGLCFSVPRGVAVPPSLRNIYAEIKAEYPDFTPPKHGNLSEWANSGVLLLNTALTVRAGAAGSHSKKGWEQFTDKVIEIVDKYGGANLPSGSGSGEAAGVGRGIVFMAWGAWAAKRVANLSQKKHLILQSAHPSPLSASRGFLGNGHFKKANDWLEARYGKEGTVDWSKLEPEN